MMNGSKHDMRSLVSTKCHPDRLHDKCSETAVRDRKLLAGRCSVGGHPAKASMINIRFYFLNEPFYVELFPAIRHAIV